MPRPVVVLSSALASPTTGGGVIVCETVRHLAADRPVTLVCPEFAHQQEEARVARRTTVSAGARMMTVTPRQGRGMKRFTLRRALSPQPGVSFNLAHQKARRVVAEVLAGNPSAQVLSIGPFAAAMLPDDSMLPRVHVCLIDVSERIIETDHARLLRRLDARIERHKVKHYERAVVLRAGAVGAISKPDAEFMSTITKRPSIVWLPPLITPRAITREAVEPRTVLFTTNYTYHHSRRAARWFLEDVWPHMPFGYRLWVTGRDSTGGELAELCRTTEAATYHGLLALPELDALYARCAVAVNPTLSGSGVQMKLMDALSRGVPVVTGSLSNPFGVMLRTARTPEEWVSAIVAEEHRASSFNYSAYITDATARWTNWLDCKGGDRVDRLSE